MMTASEIEESVFRYWKHPNKLMFPIVEEIIIDGVKVMNGRWEVLGTVRPGTRLWVRGTKKLR